MESGTPRVLKRGTPEAEALAATPQRLLEAARGDAEAIRREAERAVAERLREVEAECAALRAAAVEAGTAEAALALARVASERERALAALEPVALEAGLEVARCILRREIESSQAVLLELARGALKAAAGRGAVRLRASPGDLPALEGEGEALRALLAGAPLELTADAALGAGDLVLDLDAGRIDARIEAQLEPFRRALAGTGR